MANGKGLSEFLGGKGSEGSLRTMIRVVEWPQGPSKGWGSGVLSVPVCTVG